MDAQELARFLLNGIAYTAYPPIYVETEAGDVRLEDYLTVIAYSDEGEEDQSEVDTPRPYTTEGGERDERLRTTD